MDTKLTQRLVRNARNAWSRFRKTREASCYTSAVTFMQAARMSKGYVIACSNIPLIRCK